MKTITFYFVFVLNLLLLSCSDDNSANSNNNNLPEGKFFDAQVIYLEDMKCNLPVINIFGDTTGIDDIFKGKIKFSPLNLLVALRLPDTLKIKDIKIKIQLRPPQNNELVACKSFGESWPQVVIESAYRID